MVPSIYDFFLKKTIFSGFSICWEWKYTQKKQEKLKSKKLILFKTKPQLTQSNLTYPKRKNTHQYNSNYFFTAFSTNLCYSSSWWVWMCLQHRVSWKKMFSAAPKLRSCRLTHCQHETMISIDRVHKFCL